MILLILDYRYLFYDNSFKQNIQNSNNPYNLRNALDFETTLTRYVFLDSHPRFYFPKIWNNLPDEIKYIGSRNIFAKKIKERLFAQDFNSL